MAAATREQKIDFISHYLSKNYEIRQKGGSSSTRSRMVIVKEELLSFERKRIEDVEYRITEANQFYTSSTELSMKIAYIRHGDASPEFSLFLIFRNCSHPRRMDNLEVVFKQSNGKQLVLSEGYISSEQYRADAGVTLFCDTADFSLTENQMSFIEESSKVLVSFDLISQEMYCYAQLYCISKEFIFLMNPSDVSDDDVDTLFKESVWRSHWDEVHNAEEEVKGRNFHEFDVLQALIEDPLSLRQVKTLDIISKQYSMKSDMLSKIMKIKESYKVSQILADIDRCKKEIGKKQKQRKLKIVLWICAFIFGILFCIEGIYDEEIETIGVILVGISIVALGYLFLNRNKQPEVFFDKNTTKLIEDIKHW